jgi:hypothetical protein
MIRVLVMIAVTGFLVSLVTMSAAVGIGGPKLLEHGSWWFGPNGHFIFDSQEWSDHPHGRHRTDDGPETKT